jgi:hypothetical protein
LGALAGAAAIEATGDVRLVYGIVGILTAVIAIGFAFSPIRHGERYLVEATQRDYLTTDPANADLTGSGMA